MNKKIILSLVAVVVVAGGVAGMSAYEAHVINVTAHIENALSVETTPIEFGTVFPQEYVERDFTINLSSSFLAAGRVDDVEYIIKQKPKPNQAGIDFFGGDIVEAREYCHIVTLPDPYCYLTLCPFLSKTDGDPEDQNDTSHLSYYFDPTPGLPNSGDEYCETPGADATGRLSKMEGDTSDFWILDLKVPPVVGYVGQDWPTGCPTVSEDSQDYGCDLWIEVTGISQVETVDLENKDAGWQIIQDDVYGTMTYSIDYPTFYGNVVVQNLEPNAKYQITLNGPGGCSATDHLLASAGSNLFQSGYWNNWAPSLAPNCVGNPGEGLYNMALINDWYTVETDANGDFNYSFNLNLPSGSYIGVKVLVKKVLDPFVQPWVDTFVEHTTNLFETAPINFTILP